MLLSVEVAALYRIDASIAQFKPNLHTFRFFYHGNSRGHFDLTEDLARLSALQRDGRPLCGCLALSLDTIYAMITLHIGIPKCKRPKSMCDGGPPHSQLGPGP
jgi:hypothetical protein